MRLCTLGTSHGAPEIGRACSGNLLTINGSHYLFDCGCSVESKMTDLNLDIKNIKGIFISHMHEDHVGALTAVVKHFSHYISEACHVKVHMPEKEGLDAFKGWMAALHSAESEKVSYSVIEEGTIYSDENVNITAIRTQHLRGGEFPSFAFVVETADKRFLYTGDLNPAFNDYPEVLYQKDFDAVLCELVHFSIEKSIECFAKTRTKKMIFTHLGLHNIEKILNASDRLPYEMHIASDHEFFDI